MAPFREARLAALSIVIAGLLLALVYNLGASFRPADASTPERVLLERKGMFGQVIVSEDARGFRLLRFAHGGDIQSSVRVGDPGHLELPYSQLVPIVFAFANKPQRALLVGLGGGSMPSFLRKHFPVMEIDVVEIDPVVLEVAKSHFGFREDERLRVHIDDGRRFIEARSGRYDFMLIDAYSAESAPPHLVTREFMQAVHRALTPSGVVVSNVWGPAHNKLYDSILRTHRTVFAQTDVVRTASDGNHIVIGHKVAPNASRAEVLERTRELSRRLSVPPPLTRAVACSYGVVAADPLGAKVLLDAEIGK